MEYGPIKDIYGQNLKTKNNNKVQIRTNMCQYGHISQHKDEISSQKTFHRKNREFICPYFLY